MPNSLVWIGLVIVWIFVLFPMVVGRRSPVRRTGEATLTTRILHRGGMARPGWRGPAAGHAGDPDWVPSEEQERARRGPAGKTGAARVQATSAEAHMDSAATGSPAGEDAVLDAEIVEEMPDDGVPAGAGRAEDERSEGERPEGRAAEGETAHDGAVHDGSAHDESASDEAGQDGAAQDESDAPEDVQDEAGQSEPAAFRPGRGGFDPEADAAASAARYRIRQRVVVALGVGFVAAVLFALIFTSAFWWAALAFAGSLGLYLGYLRRQVRMEQQIRRRRMARMQRSRKRAAADRRTRETVPTAPHRESVVVLEADDEDPAFDHLPPFEDPARGDAPSDDGLRRASGQ